MATKFSAEDFSQPLDQDNNPAPIQGCRWSMATLMGCRPNPKHDTRATAERWNERYKGIKQVQVNPADFPVKQPEISEAQAEANWAKLKKLSDEFEKQERAG